MSLMIMPDMNEPSRAVLHYKDMRLPCALGQSGVRADKKEGDGCTPSGTFMLRDLWLRPDRDVAHWARPQNRAVRWLTKTDGWSDDVNDAAYNQPVRLPYPFSCEHLWRDDGLYDVLIPLGYNDEPIMKKRGSAIFFHLADETLSPTKGCVALRRTDMKQLLPHLGGEMAMEIRLAD